MFKSKVKKVIVLTRLENQDHLKVQKVMGSWKVPKTALEIKVKYLSKLIKDLDFLNNLGILAEIKN